MINIARINALEALAAIVDEVEVSAIEPIKNAFYAELSEDDKLSEREIDRHWDWTLKQAARQAAPPLAYSGHISPERAEMIEKSVSM